MSSLGNPTKRRACDSCYKRKIQCDREAPHCNHCKHHGIACTFNRIPKGRKATRSINEGDKSNASQRIDRLERKLARMTAARLPVTTQSPSGDVSSTQLEPLSGATSDFSRQLAASSARKLHFAGHHVGEIGSYNGIPLFSEDGRNWIQKRTGGVASFPHITAPPWHNQQYVYHASLPSASDYPLPSRSATCEYFSLYLSSAFGSIFQVLDPEHFKHTIDAAYDDTSAGSTNAKACVLSFLSVIVTIEGKLESETVDGDACAAKAQLLFPLTLLEPDITGLETTLMQCIYHLFTGRFQAAAMMLSLFCRMIFMLGAHFPTTYYKGTEASCPVQKKHVRNLFWMGYIFDKEISLRTGLPPAIDDEQCDLTLPEGYEESQRRIDRGWTPQFPGDLRLGIFKAKTLKLLYSVKALGKTNADLLRDIRELDHDLEAWRMSIDPRIRPTLSCRAENASFRPEFTFPQKMHIMMTHFEYHHIMATIHRASGRCRSGVHGDSGEMEGVSSSLALSVQASRASLIYLRATVQHLCGTSFWLVVFYPVSAVLTLFCNILLNPLCPQAQQDIELISIAPELIKALHNRKLTPRENLHMSLIEGFIAELVRLGDCAIQKALHDGDSQLLNSPFGT